MVIEVMFFYLLDRITPQKCQNKVFTSTIFEMNGETICLKSDLVAYNCRIGKWSSECQWVAVHQYLNEIFPGYRYVCIEPVDWLQGY